MMAGSGQWWLTFTGLQTDLNVTGKVVRSAGQPPHAGLTAVYGPYKDKATAQFALDNSVYKQERPAWSAPGSSSKSPLIPQTGPLSGLSAAGDFLGRLGQASTWTRVAETVLGLILLAVGIARLTNAVPVATSIAKALR